MTTFIPPKEDDFHPAPAKSIQSGLYHGHVGAIRQLTAELTREVFGGHRPHLIGTGGFARMFAGEELFDEIVPELVLWGLHHAERLNRSPAPPTA